MTQRWLPLLALLLFVTKAVPATLPPPAPYLFALARVLSDEGAYREAQILYERAVALDPQDPYLRIEYAEYLLRVGELRRAAEQSRSARELAPENLDALRVFAQVHLALGEQEEAALIAARGAYETIRARAPGDIQALVSLGQIYLGSERPADAARTLAEAARFSPDNPLIDSLLLEALDRSAAGEEGESVHREVLAADPANLALRLRLADLLAERGEHREASEVLAAAAPEALASPELQRRLGLELFLSGDSAAAERVIGPLLAEDPGDTGALYLRALLHEAEGRYGEAAGDLEILSRRAPANAELALALARVAERAGDQQRAAAVLEGLASALVERSRPQEAARALMERAALAYRNEAWKEAAERSLALLADADPELRREALLLLADSLYRSDQGDEALARLAESSGEEVEIAAKRLELLLRMERAAEAEDALAKLAANGDRASLLLVAQTLQRVGRYGESIPHLDTLLAREPELLQAAFLRAAALERSGRRAEAVVAFRALLKSTPRFSPALNYLGYMWAEKGENLQEALVLVQQAVSLEPANGAYVDSLGWTYFQLERYDEAIPVLERASRLEPGDGVVLEHLGDAYLAAGRQLQARSAYERAVAAADENLEQARRKLAEALQGP